MAAAHKLLGILGFDSIREEKDWSSGEASLLKVTAEIMANALVKQEAEKAIKEKEAKDRTASAAAKEFFLKRF